MLSSAYPSRQRLGSPGVSISRRGCAAGQFWKCSVEWHRHRMRSRRRLAGRGAQRTRRRRAILAPRRQESLERFPRTAGRHRLKKTCLVDRHNAAVSRIRARGCRLVDEKETTTDKNRSFSAAAKRIAALPSGLCCAVVRRAIRRTVPARCSKHSAVRLRMFRRVPRREIENALRTPTKATKTQTQ